MNNSKDVLVFCEQRDGVLQKVSLELIGEGRKLADILGQRLVVLLLGSEIKGLCQTLINHGADEVVYVDAPELKDYITEPYTKAVAAYLKSVNMDIFLIGATALGRDLAPRVAARIRTGLTADCTLLEIDEETKQLLMTRPAFGGNIFATIICPNHRPQMASIRPGVMVLPEPTERTGEINEFKVEFAPGDINVEILETVISKKKTKDITESGILVSGDYRF